MNDDTLTSDIFGQLRALDPEDSAVAQSTWRLLLELKTLSDFTVALDLAMELGLYETPFAPHLRGEVTIQPRTIRRQRQFEVNQQTAPTVWINPIDGLEMVWIPPGQFQYGSDSREVLFEDGFFLSRFPVTNQQFRAFVKETGFRDTSVADDSRPYWEQSVVSDQYDYPATDVSFQDATEYCWWAGLQLPSEMMWEKAARGMDGRLYPWGDSPPETVNWQGEVLSKSTNVATDATMPVGSFPETRSPYGCEDLVGNVSEWCTIQESEVLNRTAMLLGDRESTLQAVRGSCFLRTNANRMVASHRRRLSRFGRNRWVGFRPAFIPGHFET